MKTNDQASCPICLVSAGAYSLAVGEFKIFKCQCCGLEYSYPQPTTKQLIDFYSTFTDVRATSKVVQLNAQRKLCLLEDLGFKGNGSILDFGTGHGDFVEIAGENCFGIDFNKTDKPRIYQNLVDLPKIGYDLITLWGVLEHLVNPLETLLQLSKFAKPYAMIAITTVDAEGGIPYYYKPPEHLTYWTQRSINILFKKNRIACIEYKPYFMLQHREVYLDRLLSRTPIEFKHAFDAVKNSLPDYIAVPTNEVIIVGKFTS
jgi:transcription elongation factor Elf1